MGTRFTGDSKDPEVNVTTWCLLVAVILGVLARLGTKYHIFHRLTTDDFLIIGSSIFCIAQAICVSLAVASGYGKHLRDVSDPEFDQVMKSLWAASLLYITSLCLSKLSMSLFVWHLSPAAKDHRLGKFVTSGIVISAVTLLLGTAFQCGTPRNWDFWNGKCMNLEAWRYFACISNMATDGLILSQALFLIYGVQASFKKRLMFAGIFLPRILVIGVTIGQLPLIHHAITSNDPTYDMCNISVIEELVQCLSILTACWGQLKPFLTWLRNDGRLKVPIYGDGNTFKLQDSRSQSHKNSRKSNPGVKYGESASRVSPLVVSVTQDWEVDSQSSQRHIIQENQHPWMGEGSEPTIEGGRESP